MRQKRMRQKRIKLTAVLVLGLVLTVLQAQTMHIKQSNGTQTNFTLNAIKKMTFSSGNLTVTKSDNSNGVYALSSLRHLSFTDFSTDLNENVHVKSQLLKVYPNPVRDILNIDLTGIGETNGTLSIHNFEGKTLVSQQVSNSGVITIDFSHLPTGIYLCRYSNAADIKTVKIIKR